MARFYAPEAEGGRLADHFATLYRCWLVAAAVLRRWSPAPSCWLWPGDGPLKIAVGAGLAAILARSLAKLTQERRRAAGDVRGAALMDMAPDAGRLRDRRRPRSSLGLRRRGAGGRHGRGGGRGAGLPAAGAS